VNILAIGDIVGRPGRRVLHDHLPDLMQREGVDFCVANAENAAGGSGLTVETARELLDLGIDVLTSGDHVWKKREILGLVDAEPRLLRPANLSPEAAGRGYGVYEARGGVRVGVVNLQGRTFMKPVDCPFRTVRRILEELSTQTAVLVVDFHAEATAEKVAMGWFLDGQASAVVGTHTHIQTADERLLPNGTAYLTDLGMTGPYESVIGRRTDRVLKALITQMPQSFDVAKRDRRLCGALIAVEPETGRATSIRRVQLCSPDEA